MSFGESVFSAGFIQKTAKEDLIVKGNYRIPPWHQRGKDLEDTRRHHTAAQAERSPDGTIWSDLQTGRPPRPITQSPVAMGFPPP